VEVFCWLLVSAHPLNFPDSSGNLLGQRRQDARRHRGQIELFDRISFFETGPLCCLSRLRLVITTIYDVFMSLNKVI
jgi:hypothetical protein